MLSIVPTPIGNLDDMTFRAISTLKECSLILAEDTRTSGRLLKHFEIETPMKSFHAFNCLPGANAFIPALVSSGLPCDKFYFEGFLPHKKGRMSRHKILAEMPCTFIMYESPHRLIKCLKELVEHCGPDRNACVAREITKLHEEVNTQTVSQLLADFEARPSIKGEIVIVVQGKT